MKLVGGVVVGLGILVLAFLSYGTSSAGWSAGHSDIGFWWAVIGTFLGIAGVGTIVGSWLHTRPSDR